MRTTIVAALIWIPWVVQGFEVTEPPTFVALPDYQVFFKALEPLTLPCEAHGHPPPSYEWTRNRIRFYPGNGVQQLDNNGTLVFSLPEAKIEGIYRCFATNAHGRAASHKIMLREAMLEDFPNEPDVTYTPVLGSPLTLNCVTPESIPQPRVTWVVKNPSGGFDVVSYDARVSMDLEYRLRFTNVEASDAMGGRPYACIAVNSHLRKSSVGRQYFILPAGDPAELRPAQYMWTSPFDHFGLLGDDYISKCIFSGNPTPDVHWERLGQEGSFSNRTTIQSFGQELKIENLQFEDAGQYKCWATNSVSQNRVERTITVRVESRPYWLEEPQDVVVDVGGTALVACLAGGVPKPFVYWSINGVHLPDVTDERITPHRFKKLDSMRVEFSSLTRLDTMVLQCNATNKHGYAWVNIALKVLGHAVFDVPNLIV